MQPRIYTYKVTFEEIPDWYWGVHKEKKYGETYLGSPATHAWKWEFYTPHLQICEFFPYTDEGWVEAQNVENCCIRTDLNNPLCLNEHCGSVISLEASRRGAQKTLETIHAEKDDLGRSVQGVKNAERLHAIAHKEKDDLGRSVQGVKSAEKMNAQKWKDPQHPELGEHNPGNLVRMQKRRGYPYGKENRVLVKQGNSQ
jgi:hypothetical protein